MIIVVPRMGRNLLEYGLYKVPGNKVRTRAVGVRASIKKSSGFSFLEVICGSMPLGGCLCCAESNLGAFFVWFCCKRFM